MEKMSWPPIGSMGPIFSEYLFIRFFQRDGEETKMSDQRYWPIPKFQELLMQLNFYTVPDQKMVKKGKYNTMLTLFKDIARKLISEHKGEITELSSDSFQLCLPFSKWGLVYKKCLWCITVSSSLSHWYPGLGVVLDCIDS